MNSSASGPQVGPSPLAAEERYPAFQAGAKLNSLPLAKVGDPSPAESSFVWQNTESRLVASWLFSAEFKVGGAASHATTANLDWRFIGAADFNRDGQSDFLWQNRKTRALGLWYMNGDAVASGGSLPTPSSGWNLGGVADIDGDGNTDLVWHNPTTRAVTYWKMDGTAVTGAGTIAVDPAVGISELKAVSSGRPGRAQLVWQSSANGNVEVWTGRGTSANRAFLGSFTSPYQFDLASQTVTPITALANSGYAVVRSSLDRNFVGVSNGYSYGGEVRRLDATFSNSAALSSLPLPIRDLYLGANGQLALFGSQLRCSYISPALGGRFESLAANENKGFTWNGGALVYQLRTDGLIEALNVPSLVSQGVLDLPNLGSVDGMVATPDGRYLIISANAKIYLKELNANGL